jgi:hypothetical protein
MTQPAKTHPHMADDRRAGDRHIASDYRDRNWDWYCSLTTNLKRSSAKATRRLATASKIGTGRGLRYCQN